MVFPDVTCIGPDWSFQVFFCSEGRGFQNTLVYKVTQSLRGEHRFFCLRKKNMVNVYEDMEIVFRGGVGRKSISYLHIHVLAVGQVTVRSMNSK